MATVAKLVTKTENSSDKTDIKAKANNRNIPALDKNGNDTRQSHANTWHSGLSKGDSQPSELRSSYVNPLCTVQALVAHALVASSNPRVELDSHSDMCVFANNCLVIHDHNKPVNVYSCDPKDCNKSVKMVNATVVYQEPKSGQKFILVINEAINIDGLVNHVLCPMQLWLNGVYINEVPKFLAESPSETTHAREFSDPFHAAHPLVILLRLSCVSSYFDVYSSCLTEYESDNIPKIHLTAKEFQWDSYTNEYSENDTRMLDHLEQISIFATEARGTVFVSPNAS